MARCTKVSIRSSAAVASASEVSLNSIAERQSLLRVATGRDAADTAFLTNYGGLVTLDGLEVTAVVDDFGTDDGSELIQLR